MQTFTPVPGQFQQAGYSALFTAVARLTASGPLHIQCASSGDTLAEAAAADYRYGSVLPGLPVEVRLRSGAVFVPDDARWR